MSKRHCLWSVVALILLDSVLGRQICDLEDSACMIKAENNIYKTLVSGIKDLIDPIDPLHVDEIKGSIGVLEYEATNVTLTGMKDCFVELVHTNTKDKSYEYHLQCPKITYSYNYHDHGILDSEKFSIGGPAVATIDNYSIIIKGKYMIFNSEMDQKPRATLTDYSVESEIKGKVNFEVGNVAYGDKVKFPVVMAYLEANYEELKEHLNSHFLQPFMALIVKTYDTYIRTIPMDEVFSII